MKKIEHAKKAVLVTIALCCLIAVTCAGQWKMEAWDRLPEIAKTHFITRDIFGDQALSIMCFPGTETAWKLFVNDPEAPNLITTARIFPGDRNLIVAIKSFGTQFWYPWGLVITQGTTQYPIGFGDILEMKASFNGGQLRAGINTRGFIRLPSGLDATKPFRIWFGEQCGTIVMLSALDD